MFVLNFVRNYTLEIFILFSTLKDFELIVHSTDVVFLEEKCKIIQFKSQYEPDAFFLRI